MKDTNADMNANTNAPTAGPEVGAKGTEPTATAGAAGSVTQATIAGFMRRHSGVALSESFSGISSTASRAAQLGFTSSANSRLVSFLEDFRATPALAARYEERYPNCFFLPFAGLRRVLTTLELWLDLPQFYAGAVPDEQLPWLEIFDLDTADAPWESEIVDLLGGGRPDVQSFFRRVFAAAAQPCEPMYLIEYEAKASRRARPFWREVLTQFFVVAPPEAFTTTEDWIARCRRLHRPEEEATIPPDDPLVIRFVRGGALVVAAWGDEGAEINKLTQELKLND